MAEGMGLGTDFVDMEEIDEAHAGDVVAMFARMHVPPELRRK